VHTAERFVDIHCHMLPGLDDGAGDWGEAMAMAQLAAHDGIGTIIVTPHQLGGFGQNQGDLIRQRTEAFQELLDGHALPLRVLPGADVRIEPEMISKIRCGEVLTLADRGRYVLLELPHELYFPLDRLLGELERAGLVGILSHPERNLGLLRQPQLIAPLVRAGCLMQVTAGSLLGAFGPDCQAMAEQLVSEGLVHFLASDAHSSRTRRPLMRQAFDSVCRLTDTETAWELCVRNPTRIVTDQVIPQDVFSPKEKGTFTRWSTPRKAS
jgi:protein-tyrosine phosphatase